MEDERPAPRTRWSIAAVLAVVVAVLAATLVVVRAQDGRPRAEPGDLFDAPFLEDPLPHQGQVLLPWARTQVGAGEPREELPDILGAEATVRAPDGGSFVRVDVRLEDDYAIPLASAGPARTQETEVVLRADGRDYPLTVPGGLVLDPDGPFQQGGGVWVAVEGEPSELEVRVTVDGLTQVVDASDGSVEAGRAADLADLPSPEELSGSEGVSCGPPRRLDRTGIVLTYRPQLECRVQLVLRTPYVDGLGWAEPGREFVVVHLVRPSRDLSLSSGTGEATQYWDNRLRSSALLGGVEPVTPDANVNELNRGGLSLQDPDDPDQLIFDVPAGEPLGDLVLGLVVDAELGAPFVTERRQLRFEWTVAGGELE